MSSSHPASPTPLQALLRERGRGAQRELAHKLKMGETQLSKYARGHLTPGPKIRKRIARALGTSESYLWPEASDG